MLDLKTKQAAIEADLSNKRYEKIKDEINELEKTLKIKNIEDQRKMMRMTDEAFARESNFIDLLKKKERYLTMEEERQFKILLKEEEERESSRKKERSKIIEEHEQKQYEELNKLKNKLNELESKTNEKD